MEPPVVGVDLASGPDFCTVSVWRNPDGVIGSASWRSGGIAAIDAMIYDIATKRPPDVLFTGPVGFRAFRYARDSRWHTCRRGRVWRKGPRF